jgi:hypothetical protein
MRSNLLIDTPLSNEVRGRETLCLVFGRMLADRGFRDLFVHDPQRAAEVLRITLTSDEIAELRSYLDRLDNASPLMQSVLSSEMNSLERWKQA